MLANSQWNTRHECLWRQFDCTFFTLTSSGLGGRLLVDLNGSENSGNREDLGGRLLVDLNSNPSRTEHSFHWEDLDLYVDLPFSPLGESGDEKAQSVFEEQALSMERGRTAALDPEAAGAMPSFSADSHAGKVTQDFLTCVSNLQSTCARLEDDNAVLGCEICCPRTAETDKPMAFEERIRNTSVESSIVTLPLHQSVLEVKGKDQGNSLHPTTIDCNKETLKKADTTRLGKRPCEFSEVQNAKQRKVAHASRTGAKDNSQLPVRVGERSSSSSLQVRKETQKGKEAVGVDTKAKTLKDTGTLMKSTDWSARAGVQSSSVVEDISREEAAVEFQQCVSLLRKYGVLRTEEYLLSQNLPSSVPHPGYVGDGLLSKVCKVCGSPEDANNTVICDECQEVFHLSCCIPRLSSKFFDREDDWYCSSCRKQKKKIGSKTENSSGSGSLTSFRVSENGFIDSSGKVHSVATSYNSKVRLGQAHQVDVPLWPGKVMDEDLECCFADRPGLEVPLSQQEKDMEKERILNCFSERVQSLNWLPANMLPDGTVENWLKCQSIVKAAYKDSDGKKHSEVKCGKWRRAPLDVRQSDNWECFCVMAWDPLCADCAVPQELPNEEIFRRTHTKPDDQASEVSNKHIS